MFEPSKATGAPLAGLGRPLLRLETPRTVQAVCRTCTFSRPKGPLYYPDAFLKDDRLLLGRFMRALPVTALILALALSALAASVAA